MGYVNSVDNVMRPRSLQPVWFAVAVVVVAVLAVFAAARWQAFASMGMVGVDYETHLAFAQRFLDTGSMYLPYQLAGPFDPQPLPHVPDAMPSMYPPHAVYLFAPFLVLPGVLWWAIPLGVIGYALVKWRPAPWTWPLLALLGLNVDAVSSVIAGNTTMWLVAFAAGGLLWGWPAVLVTLKPSLLPFALLGIRHRSWWLGGGVMTLLCLPLIGQWLAYVSVVQNAETSLAYSLGSVPAMLLPVVAYFGSGVPRVTMRGASVTVTRTEPERPAF
jgi:hypothetical protein